MMQKVHFRLTSVAQKRCCLSSLLTLVPRSLLLNCTETLATQATNIQSGGLHRNQTSPHERESVSVLDS